MEPPTNSLAVFNAKQRRNGWFLLRIVIVLILLGYLSARFGNRVLFALSGLGIASLWVLIIKKFTRDNHELVKNTNRKTWLGISLRSLRLVAFVLVALIPGIGVHLALNKAVDSAVSRLDLVLAGEHAVIVNNRPSITDDFWGWFWHENKVELVKNIQGPVAWTLATLRQALVWLDLLFAAYLIFVAFWLWARFTARLFIGQSGNIRFSLKDTS